MSLASYIITGKYFSVIEKLLLIFWLQTIVRKLLFSLNVAFNISEV